MKTTIKNIIKNYLHKNRIKETRKVYDFQINSRLDIIGNLIKNHDDGEKYLKKWRKFDRNVSSNYYHVYRHLSGYESIDFIPDYLYYTFIEPQLNSYKLSSLGEEKNYYDKLFTGLNLPKTVLRNINGIFLDSDFNQLELTDEGLFQLCSHFDKIFIKPTIETGQGKNVSKFIKSKSEFVSVNGELLNIEFLKKIYGSNFIIQEFLPQSNMLNSFNEDSINTLRILTYRSIKDDKVHVIHTTLRVGKKGSIIDASRAGGRFCGIMNDGTLIKKIYDSKGNLYSDFNGIDIINNDFKLPNFGEIIKLSLATANQVHHHRILALDIMIDSNDLPRLIEVNPVAQGMFIFQASLGPMFGEFTDEILDYCSLNYKNYRSNYTLYL